MPVWSVQLWFVSVGGFLGRLLKCVCPAFFLGLLFFFVSWVLFFAALVTALVAMRLILRLSARLCGVLEATLLGWFPEPLLLGGARAGDPGKASLSGGRRGGRSAHFWSFFSSVWCAEDILNFGLILGCFFLWVCL